MATPRRDLSVTYPDTCAPLNAVEWRHERGRVLRSVRSCLGQLPKRPLNVRANWGSPESGDGFVRQTFSFHNGADAEVPGELVLPANQNGPVPLVLFLHQHAGAYAVGRREIWREDWPVPGGIARNLVRQGYAVAAIDAYAFGERQGQGPDGPHSCGPEEEAALFKFNTWFGRSLWGMMLRDEMMALDLVLRRDEIDRRRVGTIGMSMGSTRAWWLAALDDRIQVAVGVACLTRYRDLIENHSLNAHGIYYYVPDILRMCDSESVIASIAPRALLTMTGDLDAGSPISGVRAIHDYVSSIYSLHGVSHRFSGVEYPGVGHEWTPEMWQEATGWFRRWL